MHQAAGLDSTPGSAAGAVASIVRGKAKVSRRYRTPVQVIAVEGRAPVEFRWRRRRYEVRAVLAHWVEATAWWQGSRSGSMGSSRTREVWRVEAVSRIGDSGVYDLAQVADEWRLLTVID